MNIKYFIRKPEFLERCRPIILFGPLNVWLVTNFRKSQCYLLVAFKFRENFAIQIQIRKNYINLPLEIRPNYCISNLIEESWRQRLGQGNPIHSQTTRDQWFLTYHITFSYNKTGNLIDKEKSTKLQSIFQWLLELIVSFHKNCF